MIKKLIGLAFSIALLATDAAAQTGTVPLFSGSTYSGPSTITESNGNIGFGTTNPQARLHVFGSGNQVILMQSSDASFPGLQWANTKGQYTNQLDGTNASLYWFNGTTRNMTLQQNGFLGIGTQTPQAMLDVAGVINGKNFSIPGIGGTSSWAKIGTFTAGQSGEAIQITASIHSGINASISQNSTYVISFKTSNGQSVDANGFAGDGSYYAVGFNGTITPGNIKWVANAPGVNATSFSLYINLPPWTPGSYYGVSLDQGASWTNSGVTVSDPGAASSTVMIPTAGFSLPYGNVGIGTTSPGSNNKLEVNGNIALTGGSGASVTFQDGTQQTTAWTGVLCGGDYAESVDVSGDRKHFEPGDVLVVDPDHDGKFIKSTEPYSTTVMGVYSSKPGALGRRQATPKSEDEVPMAMIGIVPTKVSAENGAIKPGDLLVTSSIPGYAMKGTDRSRMMGAVIGKALGHLDSGQGVIEVGITLQ